MLETELASIICTVYGHLLHMEWAVQLETYGVNGYHRISHIIRVAVVTTYLRNSHEERHQYWFTSLHTCMRLCAMLVSTNREAEAIDCITLKL